MTVESNYAIEIATLSLMIGYKICGYLEHAIFPRFERVTMVLVFRESFKNLSRKGIKPKLTIISKSVFKQSITLIPYQQNECIDLISRVRI